MMISEQTGFHLPSISLQPHGKATRRKRDKKPNRVLLKETNSYTLTHVHHNLGLTKDIASRSHHPYVYFDFKPFVENSEGFIPGKCGQRKLTGPDGLLEPSSNISWALSFTTAIEHTWSTDLFSGMCQMIFSLKGFLDHSNWGNNAFEDIS